MQNDSRLDKDAPTPSTAKRSGADVDIVATMSVREQIDALAQALLREFMHRRGYTKTLQAFDRECPRNERTIASRQLMRLLLELPSHAFPSVLGKNPAPATSGGAGAKKPAAPTFMEELCSYRLQKRGISQRNLTVGSAAEAQADPSDAEMDEWRDAAAQRSAAVAAAAERIAEAKAKHESRLQAKREKKARLQAERHEKKEKEKEKERLHGGLAEPLGFLAESGQRRAARAPAPGGCAVGSAWTPFGAAVAEFGLGRAGPLSAPLPLGPHDGEKDAAEVPARRPEFLAGEGMSLMGERLARTRPTDEWQPPPVRRGPPGGAGDFGRMRGGLAGSGQREGSPATAPAGFSSAGRRGKGGGGGGAASVDSEPSWAERQGKCGGSPGGILVHSTGYDSSARPAWSAMRKGSSFGDAREKEKSGGRKERKVTILMD